MYKDVAEVLQKGKKVLFSGTPCQVAAVKRFTKNNENLLTVEVICHGVPNVEMLHSYLDLHSRASIKKKEHTLQLPGRSITNPLEFTQEQRNHLMKSLMVTRLQFRMIPRTKQEHCCSFRIMELSN